MVNAESEEITRETVRRHVERDEQPELLRQFDEDPDRVRRYITRLAFSADDAVRDAAVRSFAVLSRERSGDMPDFFLETIRRHIWAMNEESGNIDWAAPEIIAAVIAGNPGRYRQNFSFAFCAAIEEESFQPSLVRAFDLLAEEDYSIVSEFADAVAALRSAD